MSLLVKVENGIITEMYGDQYSPNFKEGDVFSHHNMKMTECLFFEILNQNKLTPSIVPIKDDKFNSKKNTEGYHHIVNADTKTWFRYHRGSLCDAMRTVVEVKDRDELAEILKRDCEDYIDPNGKMKIESYGYLDGRTGWDTHMVLWDYVPMGFLSGELPTKSITVNLTEENLEGKNTVEPCGVSTNIYKMFLYYCQPRTVMSIESIEQVDLIDDDWLNEFTSPMVKYTLDEYRNLANRDFTVDEVKNYKLTKSLDPLRKIYVNFNDGSSAAFEIMWDNRTYKIFGGWSSIPNRSKK